MHAHLVIYQNNQPVNSIALEPDRQIVIGRHPDCDLHFQDSKISARHCIIETQGNHYYALDQDSTNGTYVNGTRIRVRRLYDGDNIKCGGLEFHFRWVEDDQESEQDITCVDLDVAGEEIFDEAEEGPPRRIGDYRVKEKIGQGGIGEVYKVEPMHIGGEPMAIKILTPEAQQNETLVERFLREANACIALEHPRIIKVFEVGHYLNRPYFVMEYIKGRPLAAQLRENGAMSPINALKIAGHIAHALVYAHSQNIIHRDLKPANILLEAGCNHVKLIDLGLAKILDETRLTLTHHIIGTPRYMAPEQMKNPNDIDERVDIYSLGATIYAMLTGISPYAEILSNNRGALLRYMYARSPVPVSEFADVPEEVIEIVDTALAKDREERYSSAQEMFEVLYHTHKKLTNSLSGK